MDKTDLHLKIFMEEAAEDEWMGWTSTVAKL